jgi:integrase
MIMSSKSSRRGFGTIRKLPSKRYQATYIGPDLQRHRAPDTFTAKIDAEAWVAAQRRAIEAGTWRPPAAVVAAENITVSSYAEAWLATRAQLKPRTVVEYRRLLDSVILPTLGERAVASITPAVVRSWYASLNPQTPTRRAHAYQLLRAVLMTAAVEDEILAANPCRMKAAGATTRAREINPPTADELDTIVEHTPPQYRAMVLIAAWCGLRFGELAALRRSDIDGDVINVRRAAVRVDGETLLQTPKSDAGRRKVTIPPHVMPVVTEHLRWLVTGRDGLMFPTPGGLVMSQGNALNRWWHPARAAAGRSDLRFHDLRHNGGTLAAQAGATLPELMQRLGHSTVVAALRYQHAATGRDAEIARRLSALAAGS